MSVFLSFIFPPPPSLFINAMSVVSLTSLAYVGFSETRGKHLNYSKFWNANSLQSITKIKLSSRTGMLFLYTPAFLAALTPPLYYMTRIPKDIPLSLGYGGKDMLSDVNDVQLFLENLKSSERTSLWYNTEITMLILISLWLRM